MKEIIQNLGDRIDFISITEPKFKTNTIYVMLLLPVQPEHNAENAMIQAMLSSTCRRYPNMTAMARKLDGMYSASLNGSVSMRGDVMQLFISASAIDNRYALGQEDLLGELTELLLDCLFDPNAENGAFDAAEFRIRKQELLDAIEAEINNKRGYAVMRATETAFKGESCAHPVYGTKEEAEALTSAQVYEAYQRAMREAVIRIYHVGPAQAPQVADRMRSAFAGLKRSPAAIRYYVPSPCKAQPAEVNMPMEVNQSKMVLVFKGREPKKDAMKLFSAMFGAAPFSMLFMNVREKMSLCYYCASRVIAGKDALLVDSGVELANAKRAQDAILAQLEAVCRGDFSDELLENAKHSIINAVRSVGDTPSSCVSWLFDAFCTQDSTDPEEIVARYESMTKQDMMEMAQILRLDTVYLMEQEVSHE